MKNRPEHTYGFFPARRESRVSWPQAAGRLGEKKILSRHVAEGYSIGGRNGKIGPPLREDRNHVQEERQEEEKGPG
jgi:hypothetical protein